MTEETPTILRFFENVVMPAFGDVEKEIVREHAPYRRWRTYLVEARIPTMAGQNRGSFWYWNMFAKAPFIPAACTYKLAVQNGCLFFRVQYVGGDRWEYDYPSGQKSPGEDFRAGEAYRLNEITSEEIARHFWKHYHIAWQKHRES